MWLLGGSLIFSMFASGCQGLGSMEFQRNNILLLCVNFYFNVCNLLFSCFSWTLKVLALCRSWVRFGNMSMSVGKSLSHIDFASWEQDGDD